MIAKEQKAFFDQRGYLIVKGLFLKEEVERYKKHYMELRENDSEGIDQTSTDPLKRYPRLLQMHRYDQVSLEWMLDQRIAEVLTTLMDLEPYAVQTMIYFKPPKARGQALHQDQYFLRVQPGTCVAAWMALDACDEENGCLQVVPGSQDWPLLCTIKADTNLSFTDITVPIPEGAEITPVVMSAGDVLFFNGQVVHGSLPNVSENRFRRALIGHYIAGEAAEVATYYHPVLRMDGSVVELNVSEGGGTCGIWVDQNGNQVIELSGSEGLTGRSE